METYIGHIKTPQDALLILEACRRGHLRRIDRRLSVKERVRIQSGSVFVFDEREAGMRRWTDGRTWSPSRVLGSFLTYRELETKRPRRFPLHCTYKPNGLIKQSFSICTATNQKVHLLAYYTKADALSNRLRRPSADPALSSLVIPKGLYPKLNPLDVGGGHIATIQTIRPWHQQQQQQQQQQCPDENESAPPSPENPPSLSSSPTTSSSNDDLIDWLSPQDIAWDHLPWSEDRRQLKAIQQQLRI
ncbi:hypothetical protein DFQ28_001568 [Apophysomyces sp. BC1034]|nr:hypothetical protein DFQ30_001487 [Apophysomyces sp. BC1015]KAG0182519.1 hypothetical protein DFQ29_003745 [Apophysomyces sp. BC1021]KAG0194076.1 hypothetical protein DFQ28_001568 [Apophysomyces sp. BC1034]